MAAALAAQGTFAGLSHMSNGRLARRLPALALVAGAHAVALLLLVTLTRTQLLRVSPGVSTLLVVMLPPFPSREPVASAGAPGSHVLRQRPPAGAEPAPPRLPPVQPPVSPGAIDWTGDAAAAAAQAARNDEEARRKASAFALRPNAAFVPRTPPPEFHWYHAGTHRLESLDGGGTVINLTDECRLIVVGPIPLPTCDLEKMPARGDLFEHMRDAPELGAWRDR